MPWLLFFLFLMACKGGKPIHLDVVDSGATPNKIDMPIEPRIQPDRPLDIILGTRGDPTAAFVPRIVAKPNGRIGLNVEEPQADLDINAPTVNLRMNSLLIPVEASVKFSNNVTVPFSSLASALQSAALDIEQVKVKIEVAEVVGEKSCVFKTRFKCSRGKSISIFCNAVGTAPSQHWISDAEGGCSVTPTFFDAEARNQACNANFAWNLGWGTCLTLTTKTSVTH